MLAIVAWGQSAVVTLLLKVACPDCGTPHDCAALGAELRCTYCGRDFRASGDGENSSEILSVTPEELDNVPYSQRSIEVPVNSVSSIIVADSELLSDRFLRDAPLKENARWLGKVRLLKKLGQGGMGSVYRGYDESLALDVAVKVLPLPSGARDDQFVVRFRQEARISAQINHANVVRTLHVEEQGDLIYLVMDYIEGQTARNLVEKRGNLSVPLALQIIHDATKGMQAAHAHGVVHRDIKPDNILVADDGRVLLSDLGLAKAVSATGQNSRMPVTRMGLLLGTPAYMSPEQWDIGATIGPASDIWSMGATLWMLLTQKPPYDEKDLGVLARSVRESPLPDIRLARPALPEVVIDILERCLAKRPNDRFVDAEELLSALAWALDSISATPLIAKGPVPFRRAVRTESDVFQQPQAQPAARSESTAGAAPFRYAAPAPVPLRAPVQVKRWMALPAVLLCGAAVLAITTLGRGKPVPPPSVLALDLRCSTHVKLGQEADLAAIVTGVKSDEFTVVWYGGDQAYSGSEVRARIEKDTEFSVVVRDRNTSKILARRSVSVSVDLEVTPPEKDFYQLAAGTPLKLEGRVRGGVEGDIEVRWIDTAKPDEALATNRILELSAEAFAEPGRRAFVMQARRKGTPTWAGAANSKIIVEISRRVPPEYAALLHDGAKSRDAAIQSATGVEAAAHWQHALSSFEKAQKLFEDEQAPMQADQCRQRLALEEKYAALLVDARRLIAVAEKIPESDGVRRLTAWSDAMRPCSTALTLFERAEARSQAAEVELKLLALKSVLQSAEQQRQVFDTQISKARHSVKEAGKYLKPSVALPHWEEALDAFNELNRRFPKRSAEFALEFKAAQESHDKAYLEEAFGVIPMRPAEKAQDLTPSRQPIEKAEPTKVAPRVAETPKTAPAPAAPTPTPIPPPAAATTPTPAPDLRPVDPKSRKFK